MTKTILRLYQGVFSVCCLDGRRLDNLGGDERCLAGDYEEYQAHPWCAPGSAQCCLAGTVGLADLGFIL